MLTSVAAQTAKIVPITPLAGQCEEQHKKKNQLYTSCSPQYLFLLLHVQKLKVRKNKMVRKVKRKKKSSVRGLKSKALFERSAIQVGNKVS